MDIPRNDSLPEPTQQLADFAALLEFELIPASVIRRTEDLFLDWFACALAGKGARPVESLANFIEAMGPGPGGASQSEILIHRRGSSPLIAAYANVAASHFAEQDDVHNGSVFHPATIVFPAALAVAQASGRSGRELLTACVAGYEVGIRVGEFLGRSHYRIFHTTGTAGSFAAAAAVGRLLGLTPAQMRHAFGSAGTQSAGLWEFLRDAADSKQLHTAHAASAGLAAAYLARDGFTGAHAILHGVKGLAAGTSSDSDIGKLADGLPGQRRAVPSGPAPLAGRRRKAVAWGRHPPDGRWPRPRSSSTPRAATPIRPPMRCSRCCRAELEAKALALADYRGGASAAEMRGVIARIWALAEAPVVGNFLA